jgi:predicted phosphoribosyltransferase
MKRTIGFKDFLDEEIPRQQWKLNGRKSCFDREKKLPPLDGYTIMLVDDGIATGSTFMASKANRSSNF